MKKIYAISGLIALCLAGMSCVQELNEDQNITPSSGTQVSLSVSDEEWVSTKSTFTANDGIRLTKLEKIGLFYDDGSSAILSGTGSSSAYAFVATPDGTGNYSFTAPDGSLDKTWYGIVPYSKELTRKKLSANKYLMITFPCIQFPGQNTFDPATDFLVAQPFTIDGVGAKTAEIKSFKRLTAPFKLQIKGLDDGDKIYAVTFKLSQSASSIPTSNPDMLAGANTMAGRCNYSVGDEPDAFEFKEIAPSTTRSNSISAVYDKNGLGKVGDCWPVWFNVRPIYIDSGKKMTVTVFTADACYTRTVSISAGEFQTNKINTFTVNIKGSGYTRESAISQDFFDTGITPSTTTMNPSSLSDPNQPVSLTATDNVPRDWEIKGFNWTATADESTLPDALGFPCQIADTKKGYIKLPEISGKTITKVRLYLAPMSSAENRDFPLKVYDSDNNLIYTVNKVNMLDLNPSQGYTPGGIIDITPSDVDMTGMTLRFEPPTAYNAQAALVSRIVLFTGTK